MLTLGLQHAGRGLQQETVGEKRTNEGRAVRDYASHNPGSRIGLNFPISNRLTASISSQESAAV